MVLDWYEVFDTVEDAIFVSDKDSTIQKANKAFARLFNTTPEKIIGKKCYELVHSSDKPWPECPFEKTKLDKIPHTEEVNDPRLKASLSVTTCPILDDKGELIGVVHIAKDITERKLMENTLSKKLRDMEIFYKAAIDREARIKELKKKVAELEARAKG